MPRPLERESPLKRVNVMMDCDALEKAHGQRLKPVKPLNQTKRGTHGKERNHQESAESR